jgi:hypothetical protein
MPCARMHCEYASARSLGDPVGDDVPLGVAVPTLATPGPAELDEHAAVSRAPASTAHKISRYRLMEASVYTARVGLGCRRGAVSGTYQQRLLNRETPPKP